MLSLIFSRAAKRRIVGLLALGEWGPPTGAPVDVTGTISSDQPRQESILSGAVVEPVSQVVGGGGQWVYPLPRHPSPSWFDPLRRPQKTVPARTEISGSITSQQGRQESLLEGTVVQPVEVLVIAVGRASEPKQEIKIKIIGDISDDEVEMLTALLMAAD